jgi:hypothetical protein
LSRGEPEQRYAGEDPGRAGSVDPPRRRLQPEGALGGAHAHAPERDRGERDEGGEGGESGERREQRHQ